MKNCDAFKITKKIPYYLYYYKEKMGHYDVGTYLSFNNLYIYYSDNLYK